MVHPVVKMMHNLAYGHPELADFIFFDIEHTKRIMKKESEA